MKTTLVALILMLSIGFTSCRETDKKANETMDKDTMVLKSDTSMAQPK